MATLRLPVVAEHDCQMEPSGIEALLLREPLGREAPVRVRITYLGPDVEAFRQRPERSATEPVTDAGIVVVDQGVVDDVAQDFRGRRLLGVKPDHGQTAADVGPPFLDFPEFAHPEVQLERVDLRTPRHRKRGGGCLRLFVISGQKIDGQGNGPLVVQSHGDAELRLAIDAEVVELSLTQCLLPEDYVRITPGHCRAGQRRQAANER